MTCPVCSAVNALCISLARIWNNQWLVSTNVRQKGPAVTPIWVLKSCSHGLSLLLTTCSYSISLHSHTAPPPHFCCTFGGGEVRQRFSWPLHFCFIWSLQVLVAVIQKKQIENLYQAWLGSARKELNSWKVLGGGLSRLKPRTNEKRPFPLMVREWLTSGHLSLPNFYEKVNLGKNFSSESCGTGSRKEMKTFVLMENVSPERWWKASADRAGKLPGRSAAAAVMDLKENLKLERQLLQRYCLFCVSLAFQALKGIILLTPSYTRPENLKKQKHTKGNLILLKQHVDLKASGVEISPEHPQLQTLFLRWK